MILADGRSDENTCDRLVITEHGFTGKFPPAHFGTAPSSALFQGRLSTFFPVFQPEFKSSPNIAGLCSPPCFSFLSSYR
jgi:hypothetical protein